MFTGIIEKIGTVSDIKLLGTNIQFWIQSPLSNELKIDQSVSHNGVCLTVEEVSYGAHKVTAIQETLIKTNLGDWKSGTIVNLERCLPFQGRIDGHLVQGHTDTKASCLNVEDMGGSWVYQFQYPNSFAHLMIEKGSICVNGISLTAFELVENTFKVAIIPYTFNHTNLKHVKKGDDVNLEFDMMGKYFARMMELRAKQ
jgi:riboflavin synthase